MEMSSAHMDSFVTRAQGISKWPFFSLTESQAAETQHCIYKVGVQPKMECTNI